MHAVTWQAFRDELQQISLDGAYESPVPFDKLSAAQLEFFLEGLDEMEKEAVLRQIRKGVRKAYDFAARKPKVIRDASGEVIGEIPMTGGKEGVLGGVGESLASSGRSMRKAPKRAVKGEKFSREQLTQAGLPADPGLGQRMAGGAVEGAGKHLEHTSLPMTAINPLGVPIGGAIEGAFRQGGIEARRAGATRLGRGLFKHRRKAGLAGEVGAMAGMGTAAGVPLSAAGAAGGKMVGVAPAIEHGLHAAGDFVHHGAADVAGTAAQKWGTRGLARGVTRAAQAVAG